MYLYVKYKYMTTTEGIMSFLTAKSQLWVLLQARRPGRGLADLYFLVLVCFIGSRPQIPKQTCLLLWLPYTMRNIKLIHMTGDWLYTNRS